MKNLLIILIALISLTVNAQNSTTERESKIVTKKHVDANLNASNIIFECQCIINKKMQDSGLETLKMSDVATMLGAENFARFEKAVLLLNSKRLIFKNVIGTNEITSTSIMKLKYGKRFKNLATYVSFKYSTPKIITFVQTGKEVKIYKAKELVSFNDRITNNYRNNIIYTK